MSNYKQSPTIEGLVAMREAEEQENLIRDYKHIMKNIINPARRACGLNDKKLI